MFENLDKNIPIIGTVALAIQGLTGFLLSAASNAFALARSLVQMAGAGLALPGILAGMAFGAGALIAVLRDFKDVLPVVGSSFGHLRDQMSDNFWSLAEQPIRNLLNETFPALSQGLLNTASSLGVWFTGVASAIQKVFDAGALS